MEANHSAFEQVLTPSGRIRALLLGTLLLFAVSLTIAAGLAGVSQVGKPFQGFLIQRGGYLAPYQRSEWTGLKAGMRAEDVIISVDGRQAEWAGTVYDRIRAAKPGDVVRYEVIRDGGAGKPATFDVPVSSYTWGDLGRDFAGLAFVGWLYLLVGLVAAWLRPRVAAARGVWFLGLAVGTFCITYFDANSTFSVAFFCVMAISAIGAAFMYLAMIFPQEIGIVRRHPWVAWLPFAIGAAFGGANWIGYMTPGLAATTAAKFLTSYAMIRYATVWLFLGMLTYLALLPVHYLKAGRGTIARQQAAICIAGALLSFAPAGLLYGVPFIFERPPLLTLDWVLLGIIMFPLSIAYAIVRHRLFDIAVVIRRSVLYTVLPVILGSVYIGVSTALEQGILLGMGLRSREAGILATALVVGIFGPVRGLVRDAVDRRFFRTAYDARRIVEDVSGSLASMLELDAITGRIMQAVQEALFASGGALYLYDPGSDSYRPAATVGGTKAAGAVGAAALTPLPAGRGFVRHLERGEIVSRGPLPVQKMHAVAAEVAEFGADIVIPLGSGLVAGFLALGPKLSEKPYSDSDLGLLVTLANQGASPSRTPCGSRNSRRPATRWPGRTNWQHWESWLPASRTN